MSTLAVILASVFLVSIISLIGILSLSIKEKLLNKLLFIIIAGAAGTLLGAAFFDLIPEALEGGDSSKILVYVLSGIVFFFVLERFIFWHHCHDGKCDVHTFGYLNLVGDWIHNFIDGMVIAATYLTNPSLGVVTTIAIIAHEIPQEIGDFGILIYAGFSKYKALFYNFLSALGAFAGAILTYFFSSYIENSLVFLLAFVSGGFIYIATADIMPELQKELDLKKSLMQLSAFILAIILIRTVIQVLE